MAFQRAAASGGRFVCCELRRWSMDRYKFCLFALLLWSCTFLLFLFISKFRLSVKHIRPRGRGLDGRHGHRGTSARWSRGGKGGGENKMKNYARHGSFPYRMLLPVTMATGLNFLKKFEFGAIFCHDFECELRHQRLL